MESPSCRICAAPVEIIVDFGKQPLSDAFRDPEDPTEEFFFHLRVGACTSCTMVQLTEEVPRERMFHAAYPYLSSGSSVMRAHFAAAAESFLTRELTGDAPFIVELGCNDGAMLRTIADAGIRHLGVEPSTGVADMAAAKGITVRKDFFEEITAADIRSSEGPADVIYAASTLCHLPYMGSVLRGVGELLAPDGVFVFEDPYWGDIVRRTSFDQIYDEHYYFFTARSVRAMAELHGLSLVNVERLPVHGGEVRYTLARQGARMPDPSVARLAMEEASAGVADPDVLRRFAVRVENVRDELASKLRRLRAAGKRVAGYGATAKSATVLNYCGIGPETVEYIADTTPTKQGRLTPGSHIPVVEHDVFTANPPDYAVMFAWNHADEIMAKEQTFHANGGRWVRYVPEVYVV